LSIFAHGLSAMPGIKLYAEKISTLDPGAPECSDETLSPNLFPKPQTH
jgi:hypothetical protein